MPPRERGACRRPPGARRSRPRRARCVSAAICASSSVAREIADVRAAGRLLRLGERVVEAGAQRQRDDERGGGGEDRERGQRGLDRPAGEVGRARRAPRRAGGRRASSSHPQLHQARDGRGDVAAAGRPAASRWRSAPSRIVITRSARAATRASWVTSTIVWPRSSCIVRSSAITSRALAESRLPVGSSASRTRGRLISARAIATRCCWPPDRRAGRLLGVLGDAERLEQLGAAAPRLARRQARPAARAARRCRPPRGCRSG